MIGDQLQTIVSRVERLNEEIDALNGDKKEVFAEAKANGFDVKVLKHIVAERRKDPAKLAEFEALLDLYKSALGMLPEDGTDDATRVQAQHEPTQPDKPTTEPAGRSADESPATQSQAKAEEAVRLSEPSRGDEGRVANLAYDAVSRPSRGGGTPATQSQANPEKMAVRSHETMPIRGGESQPPAAGPFRPDLEPPAILRRA